MTARQAGRWLWVLAVSGSVLPVLAMVQMILAGTGGVFEYVLDDAYIHLAMSESVARGEYGVNRGEAASASSSVLFTYLLAPFAGFSWHVYAPLAWGAAALILAATLWARVLAFAWDGAGDALARGVLLAFAAFGPAVMQFHALTLVGMEHMLHICAALMVLLGLIRVLEDNRAPWYLVAGLALNPVLRFEGIGIAILGVAFLALRGHRGAAGLAALFIAAPLTAHFLHMRALGLDMLPNSVNAKSTVTGGSGLGFGSAEFSRLELVARGWLWHLVEPMGRTLIGFLALGAAALAVLWRWLPPGYGLLGLFALTVVAGHLAGGSTQPFSRYEVYAWVFALGVSAVLVYRASVPDALGRVLPVFLAVGAFYGGSFYPLVSAPIAVDGAIAIHAQQRQMARFVDDHWQAPVAVNDLGHVSYRNDRYVLDLWGLANARALDARLRGDDPLWADALAREYGVEAAMVYDKWLSASIPDSWRKVGELRLTIPKGSVAQDRVAIYALTPEAEPRLREALAAFAPGLPEGAVLEVVPR